MMFYSSSDDGSLKFWNTGKMSNQILPRFDRVQHEFRVITSGGPHPSKTIAVTQQCPSGYVHRMSGSIDNSEIAESEFITNMLCAVRICWQHLIGNGRV